MSGVEESRGCLCSIEFGESGPSDRVKSGWNRRTCRVGWDSCTADLNEGLDRTLLLFSSGFAVIEQLGCSSAGPRVGKTSKGVSRGIGLSPVSVILFSTLGAACCEERGEKNLVKILESFEQCNFTWSIPVGRKREKSAREEIVERFYRWNGRNERLEMRVEILWWESTVLGWSSSDKIRRSSSGKRNESSRASAVSPIPFEWSVPEKLLERRKTTRNYHFTRIPCSNIDTLSGCTLEESIRDRIDYDSSVVDRNVRIHFYPLLVLHVFQPIFSLALAPGKSNRRWIGRCTARRMWNSVHSVVRSLFDSFSSEFPKFSNRKFVFFSVHGSRGNFLDNAIYLLEWKLGGKVFQLFSWITVVAR